MNITTKTSIKSQVRPGPDHEIFRRLAEEFSLIRLNGKQPIEKSWQRWCYQKRRFEEIRFRPGENAGICCGPASGVLALDVDDDTKFFHFQEKNKITLPETRTHATGAGGVHFLFKYPDDGHTYTNRACKSHGFDIRGVGGQIVSPGSIHPDTSKPYVVVKNLPLAPAPEWLLDLAREQPTCEKTVSTRGGFTPTSDLSDLPVSEDTRRLIREGAPKGARSEAIMKVINALVYAGLTDAQIIEMFEQNAIGEKFREKGSRRVVWIEKQIQKAREMVTPLNSANSASSASSARFSNIQQHSATFSTIQQRFSTIQQRFSTIQQRFSSEIEEPKPGNPRLDR